VIAAARATSGLPQAELLRQLSAAGQSFRAAAQERFQKSSGEW